MKKFLLSLAIAFAATAAFAESIVVESAKKTANPWDSQFWIVADSEFAEGDVISLKMDVKADKDASFAPQIHKAPGDYLHWEGTGTVKFTSDWTTFEGTYTVAAAAVGGYSLAFSLNEFEDANKYYFDNVVLTVNGKNALKEFAYKFDNGEIQTIEAPAVVEPTPDPEPEPEPEPEAPAASKYIVCETAAMVEQPWDTQFWVVLSEAISSGDAFEFTMEVKADKAAKAQSQFHAAPGEYLHWQAAGDVNFTTDWKPFSATGTVAAEANGAKSVAFNLNDFAEANVYYFRNISFKVGGKELVVNGDLSSDDMSAFAYKFDRGAVVAATGLDKVATEAADAVAYDLFGNAGATKGFMVKGGKKVYVK